MRVGRLLLTVQAVLAALLLVGFYVVAVALSVAMVWLTVWAWLVFPPDLAGIVSTATAVLVLAVTTSIWASLRIKRDPRDGVPLSDAQAAGLWSLVRELAGAVGTRPPDAIVLHWTANAGVMDNGMLMGLLPGRRYLVIGAPLLWTLDIAQLTAVLGHELGHYSHHHLRYGAATYRGAWVIDHLVSTVGSGFANLVLVPYAFVYFLASLAVMRRMELEADRAAARLAGRRALVSALRRIDEINAMWDAVLAEHVRRARHRGYPPTRLLTRLSTAVDGREPPPDPVARQTDGLPRMLRTHPPTDARVAAVEAEPDVPGTPDTRSALLLLDDYETIGAALRTGGLDPYLEWLARTEAERDADRLYRAAAEVTGDGGALLADVLNLLADGRSDELRRALPEDDLVEAVHVAIATYAVRSGALRFRHRWEEPIELMSGDEPVDPRPVIVLACDDPARVAELRDYLLDLDLEVSDVLGWGPLPRTTLDAGSVGRPLLVDELYRLSFGPSGERLVTTPTFQAGLAAAILADLRLSGRISVDEDDVLVVDNPEPTGDRFLDSVLRRLESGGYRPVDRWLAVLGPDVAAAMAQRWPEPVRSNRIVGAAADIVAAVHAPDPMRRETALATLIWGCGLTRSVLGWRSPVIRFWLGRLASRDPLAVPVRKTII